MQRRLGRGWESRASKGQSTQPPLTPEEIQRRMASAGDPQWEKLHTFEGEEGTPVMDVGGARATMAGGLYGDDPYANMLSHGTFSAVGYSDPWGYDQEYTMGDFYNTQAGMYLDIDGFYSSKGTKFRFDPHGATGGIDVETLTITPTLDKSPADLNYVPTSSIFPARPRTVAAGYDTERGVLTVMFRDGTLYNYYGIAPPTWQSFVNARSKGRFIKRNLDGRIRGVADTGAIPIEHRELMYKVARTTQVAEGGYTGSQSRTRRKDKQERVKESTLVRARSDFKRSYISRVAAGKAAGLPKIPKAAKPVPVKAPKMPKAKWGHAKKPGVVSPTAAPDPPSMIWTINPDGTVTPDRPWTNPT